MKIMGELMNNLMNNVNLLPYRDLEHIVTRPIFIDFSEREKNERNISTITLR